MIRRLFTNAEICKIQRHEKRGRYESPEIDFDTLMSILETPGSESFADSEDSFSEDFTLDVGVYKPEVFQQAKMKFSH